LVDGVNCPAKIGGSISSGEIAMRSLGILADPFFPKFHLTVHKAIDATKVITDPQTLQAAAVFTFFSAFFFS